MAYTPYYPDWKDDPDHSTPIVAAALDTIEAGIGAAHTELAVLDSRLDAEESQPDIPAVVEGRWLKGSSGAAVWTLISIADVQALQPALDGKVDDAEFTSHVAGDLVNGSAASGVLAGTYPSPSFAQDMATQTELDTHIVATPAHLAAAIGFTPVGSIAATNVQAAIAEVGAEGGGGGGGGGNLSELFDVSGVPPALDEAPVWDGDTYELQPVVLKDAVTVAATRMVQNKLLAADAQPAFRILGSGQHQWGPGGATAPDTFLSRSAVGVLNLGTNTQKGKLRVYGQSAPDNILDALVTTDAYTRFLIQADGKHQWGDGTAALDTTLARIAAGLLALGNSAQKGRFRVYGGVVGDTIFETLLASEGFTRFGMAADGRMVWGDGTASGDTNLYRGGPNRLVTSSKFDPEDFNIPTKAGVPVDGDVVGGAQDGDIIVNTVAKAPYVRIAGVWETIGGGGGGGGVDYKGAYAPATPYVAGDVVLYNGVEYVAVNPGTGQTPPAVAASAASLPVVGMGTTFPVSPFNRQEFILTDNADYPAYFWRFVYIASKASNKWLFIGGVPMVAEVTTLENATFAGAYGNLATVGPTLTIPVAGDYDVTIDAILDNASASLNYASYAVGATAAIDADAGQLSVSAPSQGSSVTRTSRKAGLAGGVVLTAKYKGTAGATYASKRVLSALPVAVGG